MWRKTRRPNNESALNCVGTDANRNWGFHWNATDGASTDPCSKNFMGPHPFSEVLHTCHPFLRKSSDWDCERPRLPVGPQRPVEVLHEPALLWGDGPPALGLHWGEAWQHRPADWGGHLRVQISPKSCKNSNILSVGGNTGRWCYEGKLSGAKFSKLMIFLTWSIVWAGYMCSMPDSMINCLSRLDVSPAWCTLQVAALLTGPWELPASPTGRWISFAKKKALAKAPTNKNALPKSWSVKLLNGKQAWPISCRPTTAT